MSPRPPKPSPKTSRTKVTVAIAAALVVIGAVAIDIGFHRSRTQAQTDSSSAAAGVRSVIHLESFVVNLSDPGENAFLRVGIDLGVGTADKPGEKGSPLTPKIRDVILSVLTTASSNSLLAPDGKTRLKTQLLSALNDQVPSVPVKEVYFTEFLVQR